MPKNRIEGLSDKVFVIILTILIIKINLPQLNLSFAITDSRLWEELAKLGPILLSYLVSFAVISTFWVFHSSFYSIFSNNRTDRILAQLNTVFLAALAIIPFSTDFIRNSPGAGTAIALYGISVLVIAIIARIMLSVAIRTEALGNDVDADTFKKMYKQASTRGWLNLISIMVGIGFAFFPSLIFLSYIFFTLPVMFNIIPGIVSKLRGSPKDKTSMRTIAVNRAPDLG